MGRPNANWLLLAVCAVLPISGLAANTTETGGGQPHSIMQPYLGLNYIIAMEGAYPSVNGASGDTNIGEISLFAGSFAPSGWAFAHGQILTVSDNQALHSILGDTYGGDGISTFALPDLRGRIPLGVGEGAVSLGEVGGAEGITLTEFQMPSHHHSVVPEPSTLALMTLAAIDMLGYVWRRRCRAAQEP